MTAASPLPRFEAAFPFQDDVLALPTKDIDQSAEWYAKHFGLTEVERRTAPKPCVIMARDGAKVGFEVNGGDATQDGAAFLVSNIEALHAELTDLGAKPGDFRIDERDGQHLRVFFVVAPDGLCFYFHQPVSVDQ